MIKLFFLLILFLSPDDFWTFSTPMPAADLALSASAGADKTIAVISGDNKTLLKLHPAACKDITYCNAEAPIEWSTVCMLCEVIKRYEALGCHVDIGRKQ